MTSPKLSTHCGFQGGRWRRPVPKTDVSPVASLKPSKRRLRHLSSKRIGSNQSRNPPRCRVGSARRDHRRSSSSWRARFGGKMKQLVSLSALIDAQERCRRPEPAMLMSVGQAILVSASSVIIVPTHEEPSLLLVVAAGIAGATGTLAPPIWSTAR